MLLLMITTIKLVVTWLSSTLLTEQTPLFLIQSTIFAQAHTINIPHGSEIFVQNADVIQMERARLVAPAIYQQELVTHPAFTLILLSISTDTIIIQQAI